MIKKIAALAAMAALISVASSSVYASGFRLPDEDVAAMGMANAFSAQADNPSANWYNPAALVWLEGTQAKIGSVFIRPTMSHQNIDGTTDKSDTVWHAQPHAYFSHKINEDFAFGFAMTAPFGLSTNWATTAETANDATYSNLKVLNYNLNGAYKINDKFSVALGFDVATIDAWLYNTGSYESKLSGNGKGVGFNAAVAYKPSDTLSFDMSYRSKEKMSINGTLTMVSPVPVSALNSSYVADTTLTLPDIFMAGVSYKATSKLRVNADFDYTGWSSYDELDVHNTFVDQSQLRDWNNSCAIRLGGEYAVTEALKTRLGIVYDATPLSNDRYEPRIPDADRMGYSAGASYAYKAWTFDASYMYLRLNDRTVSNSLGGGNTVLPELNGTWSMDAQLVGLSTSYKF